MISNPVVQIIPSNIPSDVMIYEILPHLKMKDWGTLCRVCTVWKEMIQETIQDHYEFQKLKFGKEQCLSIPGVKDVGEEPVLSIRQVKKVMAKLRSACPFFNEPDAIQPHRFQNDKIKQVWQTHMLILFPATINGEPRTVNSIGKIFHFLNEGFGSFQKGNIFYHGPLYSDTVYEYIYGKNDAEYRNKPAPSSYFALITMDLRPGSRGKTFETITALVEGKGYRILNLNEAVTSTVIMNFAPFNAKKGYLFGRSGNLWTYTTTTEKQDNFRLVVGVNDSKDMVGVIVNNFSGQADNNVGAACAMDVETKRP